MVGEYFIGPLQWFGLKEMLNNFQKNSCIHVYLMLKLIVVTGEGSSAYS